MSGKSYTPEEVAKALNIKKNTVYELIKRGELSAYRIGRKIRVDETAIVDYKGKMQSTGLQSEKADKNTFVISGQDVILDILASRLEAANPGVKVLRSHKGSYNALYDLYNDVVNAATAHLWDGDTDSYNTTYVRSMLPGVPAAIFHLVKRFQGFYIKKGNPRNITGWNDLARNDLVFVNREKGSGTRVLLDERLRLMGVAPNTVNGYDTVAASHLQVVSSVARGFADYGLGIEKAVNQVGDLDFIPLQRENYDIIIKAGDMDQPIIQSMLKIIASDDYKNEVLILGGYEL